MLDWSFVELTTDERNKGKELLKKVQKGIENRIALLERKLSDI